MQDINDVAGTPEASFKVSFLQGPATRQSRVYAVNVMIAWTLVVLASSLLLRAFRLEPHGACAAAFVAFVACGPLLMVPFGLCTCTVTATAFVFRPFGHLGRADTTPLVDILGARLVSGENPSVELDLKTGVTKQFGPWKPLTLVASLDHRHEKLTRLVNVINNATDHL